MNDLQSLVEQNRLLLIHLRAKRDNLHYLEGSDSSTFKKANNCYEHAKLRHNRRIDNLYGDAIEDSIKWIPR